MSELAPAAPRLLYSVPSLGIDDSKGPPTFVFVTHEIPLHDYPYSFPEDSGFFITNGWLGEPGAHQQRIELLHPSGALLLDTGDLALGLIDDRPYMAITYFQGITFQAPGKYQIRISVNGAEVSVYPLYLTQADPSLEE